MGLVLYREGNIIPVYYCPDDSFILVYYWIPAGVCFTDIILPGDRTLGGGGGGGNGIPLHRDSVMVKRWAETSTFHPSGATSLQSRLSQCPLLTLLGTPR